jgi:methylated-DNA-[protein]-cysteine S-methyltransferase
MKTGNSNQQLPTLPERFPLPENRVEETLTGAVETPYGWLGFALTTKGLKSSTFMYPTEKAALDALYLHLNNHTNNPETAQPELLKPWRNLFLLYFSGQLKAESHSLNVPIDDSQWTEFARRVYRRLRQVPAGNLLTYGELAAAAGSPGASQAVGNLMKTNPIPPIVPCHRVVAGKGKLGGFSAAGGTSLKIKMLKMEGVPFIEQKSLFGS